LITELIAARQAFATRLAQRKQIPPEDRDTGEGVRWLPSPHRARATLILQPPRPAIRPSSRVLERLGDRDADREATE
jgi:hypothetical protein